MRRGSEPASRKGGGPGGCSANALPASCGVWLHALTVMCCVVLPPACRAREPYTGGAYSAFMPLGAWTAFGPAWARPHGRVYWAGTGKGANWCPGVGLSSFTGCVAWRPPNTRHGLAPANKRRCAHVCVRVCCHDVVCRGEPDFTRAPSTLPTRLWTAWWPLRAPRASMKAASQSTSRPRPTPRAAACAGPGGVSSRA